MPDVCRAEVCRQLKLFSRFSEKENYESDKKFVFLGLRLINDASLSYYLRHVLCHCSRTLLELFCIIVFFLQKLKALFCTEGFSCTKVFTPKLLQPRAHSAGIHMSGRRLPIRFFDSHYITETLF